MNLARIALSVFTLSLFACQTSQEATPADDEPQEASGIGTSPSEPVEGVERAVTTPPLCGVWYSHDGVDDAWQVSLERGPDVVVYSQPGGLSCSWAFQLSALVWPGKSFIRPWH